MSSPRTSKTVLGTLRFARVPWTVFEVLGLDIPQGPEENRGTFSLYPGYAGLPLFGKRGTLGVLFSNVPRFSQTGGH